MWLLNGLYLLVGVLGQKKSNSWRKGYKGNPIKYTRDYKLNTQLSNFQKEALAGLMLGDLHAERTSLNGDTRLSFDQTLNGHSEYLEWLCVLFEPFVGTKPRPTNRKPDARTGKIYNSLQFKTLRFPCFNLYRDLFYTNGAISGPKTQDRSISNFITAISLAFWIMDDGGHTVYGGLTLHTNNQTKSDVQFLINVLSSKFSINSRIEPRANGQQAIHIPRREMAKVILLVKPHMHKSMFYKLGL